MIENYYSVTFGDGTNNIGQYLAEWGGGVTSIPYTFGGSRTNSYTTGIDDYGLTWSGVSYGQKPFPIQFVVSLTRDKIYEFGRGLDRLVDSSSGPKQLTIEDVPNVYYNAVFDGELSIEYNHVRQEATGTLNFVVEDGLGHSKVSKMVDKNTTDDRLGKVEIVDNNTVRVTVNNDSTVPAYPKIKIHNVEDTGWISIVGQEGVLELGNSEATADGYGVDSGEDQSQTLIDLPADSSKWKTSVKRSNLTKSPNLNVSLVKDATASYGVFTHVKLNKNRQYGNGLHWNKNGKPGGYAWFGCGYEIPLPKDKNGDVGAKNFICDFNIKAFEHYKGQVGLLQVIFMDTDGIPLVSYDILKDDRNGTTCYFRFREGTKVYESYKFNPDDGTNSKVKDRNKGYNMKTGNCRVSKEGPKFTYTFEGNKYSANFEHLQDRKCGSILFVMGASKKVGKTKYMTVLGVKSLKFVKTNVDKMVMNPNRFKDNSEVTVNMENGEIEYIADPSSSTKGINAASEFVIGSQFFPLPPGKSTIEVNVSNFTSKTPEVSIEWFERYRV